MVEGEDPRAMCEFIKSTKSLRVLNLRDNLLRDRAGEEIAMALKQNLCITRCYVELNPLKHSIVLEVEKATKRN